MIDTSGMISVDEAARRLHRSREQVRRKLRSGQLKGQRVGQQWFVDEAALQPSANAEPLIPPDFFKRIDEIREAIYRRNGKVFDVVELLRQDRESH